MGSRMLVFTAFMVFYGVSNERDSAPIYWTIAFGAMMIQVIGRAQVLKDAQDLACQVGIGPWPRPHQSEDLKHSHSGDVW